MLNAATEILGFETVLDEVFGGSRPTKPPGRGKQRRGSPEPDQPSLRDPMSRGNREIPA